MVTIRFPDEILRKLPPVAAKRKAIDYASELLQNEILNDPNFKVGFGWKARKEEVIFPITNTARRICKEEVRKSGLINRTLAQDSPQARNPGSKADRIQRRADPVVLPPF